MTTTREHRLTDAVPRSARAEALLRGLAVQDFTLVGVAFTSDAQLRALLPARLRELAGADVIAEQFACWFGETEEFEFVESTACDVGGRMHLQWRLRLQAERLGAGWFTVEQHAYADTADDGRITRLDVLCTGYRREAVDG